MLTNSVKLVPFCCAALLACAESGQGGPFSPAAGLPGSEAIVGDDIRIVAWAERVESFTRGPIDISEPNGAMATFGTPESALGPANALQGGGTSTDPSRVVSLGDGGSITLIFDPAITDGPGPDFAVFENAFSDTFLELAFVEVSSNGIDFFRFPSVSLTPTRTQVDQADEDNDAVDPTNIDGLAGKYRVNFGTPFDLQRLIGVSSLLDVSEIRHVRVIDVVGSILPEYARRDSALSYTFGGLSFTANHIINDPWKTDFFSGGFDLDALGVLHQIPESTSASLLGACGVLLGWRRRVVR